MVFSSRSSRPEVFLVKSVLNICNKLTEEHLCRSVISIKLLCNIIEITLRHGCSPVNLLHIFRTPFPRNTSGWLLLWFSARSLLILLQTTVQYFFSLLQCLVFICGYIKVRFILFVILWSHFYIRYYERSLLTH